MTFAAADPGFEGRVRKSFSRLALMRTIGARLVKVAPGEVDVDMPFRDDLTQQHGFVAAGIVTAIVDTACGYAAMSLMPAGATVLTVMPTLAGRKLHNRVAVVPSLADAPA